MVSIGGKSEQGAVREWPGMFSMCGHSATVFRGF